MDELKFESYWNDIPTVADHAATYPELMTKWKTSDRVVRQILNELSRFDNGDNYILIRSGRTKGFYKTDDPKKIEEFKRECLSKGRSVFSPIRKINRVLSLNNSQISLENNMRIVREAAGMKQAEVCKFMKDYDSAFDNSLLSKMENGVCMPTPYQLSLLAQLYNCCPDDLIVYLY